MPGRPTEPMSNCGYGPVMMMESFWVTVWLSSFRFSLTAIVGFDDALKDIFGWKRVPCVSTYTRFFKMFYIGFKFNSNDAK